MILSFFYRTAIFFYTLHLRFDCYVIAVNRGVSLIPHKVTKKMAFLNGTPFFLYIDYIDGYCKYPFVARG